MRNNVILIGMPGSGKSTIGVVLAKLLCYQFVDMDIVIQEQEKKLLREIIADVGNEGFMEIENRVNAGFYAEHTVIAPGGSVIYGKEAMEHLREIGVVIYLKLSYENLATRLGDLKARGVVLKDGYTLRTLYEERTPLYEKYADIIIDEGDMELIDTVAKIKGKLESNGYI
ncbi:MAG: shikimate kinase [Lachnospiraceae bacterium]|nr:shikimate kinase [Lachnospiraceae bacterium]